MNGRRSFLDRFIKIKYFGKYRGTVIDNKDPKKLGRLKLSIPEVLGDEVSGWALPCLPYGGTYNQGMFMVPEVGAQVWVDFEAGIINHPIWVGTFWKKEGDPPNNSSNDEPTTRMLQTKSGHILEFDDAEGEERIRLRHSTSAVLFIDQNGSISLIDASRAKIKIDAKNNKITFEDVNGNTLIMNDSGINLEDANGNSLIMNDSGINVENTHGNAIEMFSGKITIDAPNIVLKGNVHLGDEGGEAIIKGQSFLSLFMTHIHTSAPVVGGPTSPPVPQGELAALTTTVKTK